MKKLVWVMLFFTRVHLLYNILLCQNQKRFYYRYHRSRGSYLAEFLLEKNYQVYGLLRRNSNPSYGNVSHLRHEIKFVLGDLADPACISMYLARIQPSEIYNLGSQSHVHESWLQPLATADQTGLGALRIYEAVRNVVPKARVYQASTSELFGATTVSPQNENTPVCPANPYASASLAHFDAQISAGLLIFYVNRVPLSWPEGALIL
jgi:GDP-mannose 4,6-dehydratase